MEQSLRQKVAKIDKLRPIKPTTTGNSVMLEIRLKTANLAYSKMLHLQVTCEIQIQRQEVLLCVFWITHGFVRISWTCKKQTAVSHISAESEMVFA